MIRASHEHKKIKFSLRLSERLGREHPINREEEEGFGGRNDSASLVGT